MFWGRKHSQGDIEQPTLIRIGPQPQQNAAVTAATLTIRKIIRLAQDAPNLDFYQDNQNPRGAGVQASSRV